MGDQDSDDTDDPDSDDGDEIYVISGYQYVITASAKNGYGTVMVVGRTSKSKSIVIKNVVRIAGVNYRVTAVDEAAFMKDTRATSVKIGKYVTEIGAKAFSGCTKLKSVTIGSAVKKIGKQAFYNCKSLTKMTITTSKLTKAKVGSAAWKKAGKKKGAKLMVKVPKKKYKLYKQLLQSKGLSKKAVIRK